MKRIYLLFVGGLFFLSSYAGSYIDIESIKERYAKYNAVILEKEYNYLFDINKDSLVIKQTNTKQILVLNEHSKAYTNGFIYYTGFTTIDKKEAYTLVPKGKRYDKIKVDKYNESHDRNGSVFYDDTKTIRFLYPALKQGAITSLKYTINYNNPRFIRNSYFQSYIPILKLKIIVKVHRDINVGYKLFNDQDVKINFKEYSKGKYNYLEWEVYDIEPYKYLSGNSYTIKHYSPHIALYVNETNIKGLKKKYFGAVGDLYKFYQSFISKIDDTPSVELKQLVDELTYGLSKEEKARAIYYWVQNNIKYVAYAQGYMGFIPASSTEVFTKRYGDCKGMSSLIKEMMELVQLSAHYTWVGTRSIPYTYQELPLPSVDNHMIISHFQGDSILVMDGTFKYLDYGVNPYHIMGKEIMIGMNAGQHKIYKVPVAPASYSVVIDSSNISLINNSIVGNAKRIHKGFNRVELAYAMDGVKKSNYGKKFSKLFNKGSNKFKVEHYQVYNLFERDIPAEVDYEFRLDDYSRKVDDIIYINLNLDKSYLELFIDTSNIFSPIENDFYYTERYITRFEIPEGYEISHLPKGGSFDHNDFRFSLKYWKEGNYIIFEKEVVFEFLIILEDQINEWNQMIKQLSKHYRSSLALKKINS